MMDDLQEYLDGIMNERNNMPVPEFEAYTPTEMEQIFYNPFGEESPVQIKKLQDIDYLRVPILNQIMYLVEMIQEKGEVKLTAQGYLPTKIVADIYERGFLKDQDVEEFQYKVYKEMDSITVNLTHILIVIMGLVKKRHNKLSITKIGEKLLSDKHALLKKILEVFSARFNWAYFDGYGENHIGQYGFGFSLILLSKFGKIKRQDIFYADKYFKAYPNLLADTQNKYQSAIEYSIACYSLRTFDRFLDYFGLINIEKSDDFWFADKYISKTDMFDKLIQCRPPGKQNI